MATEKQTRNADSYGEPIARISPVSQSANQQSRRLRWPYAFNTLLTTSAAFTAAESIAVSRRRTPMKSIVFQYSFSLFRLPSSFTGTVRRCRYRRVYHIPSTILDSAKCFVFLSNASQPAIPFGVRRPLCSSETIELNRKMLESESLSFEC